MILSEILEHPERYSWSDALYAERVKSLSAETRCLVHDPDDVEDEELDLPNVAIAVGFDYVISIQTLQSIVENARLQGSATTLDDRVQALNYYLDNDAFIVL